MRAKWLLLILALAAGGAGPVDAQILVAPIQLFLGARTPMNTFYVYNQSQQPQEVSISFRFGYPVSGDNGDIRMLYGDTLPLNRHSMQAWVRAFPKQFVLAPGQRQEVRVTVRPPQELPEGMYWTRLVTASSAQAPPADSAGANIVARINFRLEQITTVLYARGRVATALQADTPRVRADSSGVAVLALLTPGGNAPFFGTATVRLLTEQGTPADVAVMKTAIYMPMVQRFDFSRRKLPAGRYIAELSVASERDDISPQDLLHVEPVVRRVPFTIP